MDPSHKQPHIISDIDHVKTDTENSLHIALGEETHVFSALTTPLLTKKSEETGLRFSFLMQAFFGSAGLAMITGVLVARAFLSFAIPDVEAERTRQMPPTVCHGSFCMETNGDSSSSVRSSATITAPTHSSATFSSAPAVVTPFQNQASSAGTDTQASKFNPFHKFHAAPPDEPSLSPVRVDNKIGVYLTAPSVKRTDFLDTTIDELTKRGGDSIVIDVKGGQVFFENASPMANQLGLVHSFYDLPAIVQKFHDHGIYVMARFVAIKDYGFTQAMPDTRIKDPKTGVVLSQTWVDPSNDVAIAYNMEVVKEVALAKTDEILFDYIRFPTEGAGALMAIATQEKIARVQKFIHAARETVDALGLHTKLGISTYAILGWDYDTNVRTLGQAYDVFEPDLDIIAPMAYPASFKSPEYYNPEKNGNSRAYWLVYHTLKGYADRLGPEKAKKLRPWLQAYSFSPNEIDDEIRAVYDAGLCGFQFWNANNNYGPVYGALDHPPKRPDTCL